MSGEHMLLSACVPINTNDNECIDIFQCALTSFMFSLTSNVSHLVWGRIRGLAPCTQSSHNPQQWVSILILNITLMVGCFLKQASDANIDKLPPFNSVNLLIQKRTPQRQKRQKDNVQRVPRKRGVWKEVLQAGRNKVKDRQWEREGQRDRQKKRLMRQSGEIENWMIKWAQRGREKIREEESRRSSYPFTLQLIWEWMRLLS